MDNIIQYEHYGTLVSVQENLRGKHRSHCLCYQNCKHFKPGQGDHCQIAKENYELCVKNRTTQVMWECPKYEQ
jgi:hypothetical protein